MRAGHDAMRAGHDAMGDRNGSGSAQIERGRHGQNIPKQPAPLSYATLLLPLLPRPYSSFPHPSRHSRIPHVIPASLTSFPRRRESRSLAPDMRTHAEDDATNRAAAQIWKKGRRGCRVIAKRRT